MSGQQNLGKNERSRRDVDNDDAAQAGSQRINPSSTSSNLFNPNYRGPQANTNASGMGYAAQPYNMPVYRQDQAYGRGFPTGRGGHQGRGGAIPPYSGPPLGSTNPQFGYQQPAFSQQQTSHLPPTQPYLGRGAGNSGPARFSSPAPRGGHRQPLPPPARPPPASSMPSRSLPPTAARPTPAGHGAKSSSKQFGEDDFPSLGSQLQPQQQRPLRYQQPDVERGLTRQLASQTLEDQSKASAGGRGGSRRAKFVPFTDYDPSISTAEDARQSQPSTTLPPARTRRNEAFRLNISECYRGKIIFIDELSGIDYSNHPAIIRSIDYATKKIVFFKKSSFKGIGGFLNKYGEYVNQSQKRWHEKQWLLVDDGVTKPHHGTPLLKLAKGEKMPEKGSYVDIHGDSELHIDYFSKYSRYGVFPDIYLPEDQMRQLEEYSEWYLEKDQMYRAAEERKKKERWQLDGSADVDIGDIYDDSENEDGE